MHKIISDANGFKSEKSYVCIVHLHEWPFPVMWSSILFTGRFQINVLSTLPLYFSGCM